MLQIVYQFKKFILGGLNTGGSLIGDTKKFQGIFGEAAFYVIILNTPDLDLTVNPLELPGVNIGRKMGGRNFYGNQFGVGKKQN